LLLGLLFHEFTSYSCFLNDLHSIFLHRDFIQLGSLTKVFDETVVLNPYDYFLGFWSSIPIYIILCGGFGYRWNVIFFSRGTSSN